MPQIEGLTSHDFLEYAQQRPGLLKYFPDERDWVHLDKHWICDVLYTLETDGIQELIDKAMDARREKLEEKRDLNIPMRPEFIEALNQCHSFSSNVSPHSFLL